MPTEHRPLYVRLPRAQAVALDRLAQQTGRPKQHLISEMLGTRLPSGNAPPTMGRVDLLTQSTPRTDEVLTLEEAAAVLKVSADVVRSHAESGDLPGRLLAGDWRFARTAVIVWLADGEPKKGRRQ